MASFKDLSTDAGLKELDAYLAPKSYITGYQASRDDLAVYAALSAAPDASKYVNAARWYSHVTALLGHNFSGAGVGVSIGGSSAPAAAAAPAAKAAAAPKSPPPAAPKAAAPAPAADDDDDDDDVDLFGEETEEEKKAKEAREAAAKASGKKKVIGKSSILLDVKPWDDETDMKKLEAAVRAVKKDGLVWGGSKLLPVGYGINKLNILMTIEDEKVSIDELIEDDLCGGPETSEYVQSCDIVAFNKI
jgi:elongation factor 1-beta